MQVFVVVVNRSLLGLCCSINHMWKLNVFYFVLWLFHSVRHFSPSVALRVTQMSNVQQLKQSESGGFILCRIADNMTCRKRLISHWSVSAVWDELVNMSWVRLPELSSSSSSSSQPSGTVWRWMRGVFLRELFWTSPTVSSAGVCSCRREVRPANASASLSRSEWLPKTRTHVNKQANTRVTCLLMLLWKGNDWLQTSHLGCPGDGAAEHWRGAGDGPGLADRSEDRGESLRSHHVIITVWHRVRSLSKVTTHWRICTFQHQLNKVLLQLSS